MDNKQMLADLNAMTKTAFEALATRKGTLIKEDGSKEELPDNKFTAFTEVGTKSFDTIKRVFILVKDDQTYEVYLCAMHNIEGVLRLEHKYWYSKEVKPVMSFSGLVDGDNRLYFFNGRVAS